ncbi:MAG: MerR family transcriptional regulator [Eubacteriales bacterium]|nr:MerR family transcriptional regulator [Eubacteriales bacterium]
MTVHEVAKLAGVSERTLRYYDRFGLLPPTATSPAGYRLYDRADLEQLQRILFLRELDFPLKEIVTMLVAEANDQRQAILRHHELLEQKKMRLQGLIDLCERLLKGEDEMSLREFDQSGIERLKDEYAREAKERWGESEAFHESEKRTAAYGDREWNEVKAESETILREFAALTGHDPTSPEVRKALAKWRDHINARFYPCTDEILAGLGEMYVADERFQKTLDEYGKGTARLMSEAIRRRNE